MNSPGSYKLLFAGVLLSALAPDIVGADIGQRPFDELHRQVWTTRQGVPHNTVNAIAQTPDGYLWLATWEGIARFNGYQFRLFDRGPETGLPDAGVLSLSVDERGQLLAAGARGGIVLTDGHRWQALETAPSMVTHAFARSPRELWIASQGAGVIRRELDEELLTHDETSFLPGASATQLIEHEGVVWAATSRGLLRVGPEGHEVLSTTSGLPAAPVLSLLVDRRGRLLAATEQGLYVRETGGRFRPLHPRLAELAVSTLLEDDSDALWIGTINAGLFRLNRAGVSRLGTEAGLPNNRVLSLHQDLEGSLWVGTNGGLLRLRSAPFVTLTRQQGLAGNYVRAVMPHSDGSLWVGTSEGVSRLAGGLVKPLNDAAGELDTSVLSLAELPGGDVLVGTHSDGVLRWREGAVVERHDRGTGLPANDIRFMHVDSSERLWIATASGLARVVDGSTEVFLPKDGLPGDFVIALLEDSRDTMWVGTGFGLARFEGGRFEPVSLYHLDKALYVYGIHEDRDRYRLWLATDRCLVRFDPETSHAELVGREAGIPVDKLFHLVDDRHGAFWLTSNRGIVRIRKADAEAFADGELPQLDFELYTEADGLLSAQANGGAGPPATWHDGHVWIATAVGLSRVNPDHLSRYEDSVLPVSIERFEADARALPVNAGDPAELPPGTGRVVFNYAGLGFVMPQRIRYRTHLEGFDSGWVGRHDQRVAEYTNLGPGEYVFRVSASYPYGEWSGAEAAIAFRIAPLPWQRTWFWVAAALATVGLVLLVLRWRTHALERRAGELRAQVSEKTRELQRQAENFEHQARIDQLTGLANRRAFDEELARQFRVSHEQGRPLSLVVMDLDHFKTVNDRYSHLVGDRVMCIVADVLRRHIRSGDQAARWGGEEFTLTFHATDSAAAERISERIRASIESTDFSALAPGLTITASFGISDSRYAHSYETLMQQADQALYRAKAAGRNRVIRHDSSSAQ